MEESRKETPLLGLSLNADIAQSSLPHLLCFLLLNFCNAGIYTGCVSQSSTTRAIAVLLSKCGLYMFSFISYERDS